MLRRLINGEGSTSGGSGVVPLIKPLDCGIQVVSESGEANGEKLRARGGMKTRALTNSELFHRDYFAYKQSGAAPQGVSISHHLEKVTWKLLSSRLD